MACMPGSIVNSLITSASAVVLLWVVCSMAAYAFALMQFRGREILFLLVLAAVLVPVQVIMFPLFVEVRALGLTNSLPGLTLGFVIFGIPLTTFQFAAYFKTLPVEVLAAARVDGASTLQTLIHVVLPDVEADPGGHRHHQLRVDVERRAPAIHLIQDSDKKPLVAQLAIITQSQYVSASIPVLASVAVLGFAPTVAVYLIAQRQIVRGITAGAIK